MYFAQVVNSSYMESRFKSFVDITNDIGHLNASRTRQNTISCKLLLTSPYREVAPSCHPMLEMSKGIILVGSVYLEHIMTLFFKTSKF